MNWSNVFRSRLSLFLEAELTHSRAMSDRLGRYYEDELRCVRLRNSVELDRLETRHAAEIQRIESLNQTIQYEAMRELTEVKRAHAEELSRAINNLQKTQDELTKVRYVLNPALQTVDLEPDRTPPPSPSKKVFRGTPWQQVQQREMQLQDEEAAKRLTTPVGVAGEGETVHAASSGRDAAPQ